MAVCFGGPASFGFGDALRFLAPPGLGPQTQDPEPFLAPFGFDLDLLLLADLGFFGLGLDALLDLLLFADFGFPEALRFLDFPPPPGPHLPFFPPELFDLLLLVRRFGFDLGLEALLARRFFALEELLDLLFLAAFGFPDDFRFFDFTPAEGPHLLFLPPDFLDLEELFDLLLLADRRFVGFDALLDLLFLAAFGFPDDFRFFDLPPDGPHFLAALDLPLDLDLERFAPELFFAGFDLRDPLLLDLPEGPQLQLLPLFADFGLLAPLRFFPPEELALLPLFPALDLVPQSFFPFPPEEAALFFLPSFGGFFDPPDVQGGHCREGDFFAGDGFFLQSSPPEGPQAGPWALLLLLV